MNEQVVRFILTITLRHILSPIGLDSDESYEGVSEASFKDALVFDGSSQKDNGSVPQENGIKKHRYCWIPAPHSICKCVCVCVFVCLSCIMCSPETIWSFLLNLIQCEGQGHNFYWLGLDATWLIALYLIFHLQIFMLSFVDIYYNTFFLTKFCHATELYTAIVAWKMTGRHGCKLKRWAHFITITNAFS